MQGRYDAGIAEPLRRLSTKGGGGGNEKKKFFLGQKQWTKRQPSKKRENGQSAGGKSETKILTRYAHRDFFLGERESCVIRNKKGGGDFFHVKFWLLKLLWILLLKGSSSQINYQLCCQPLKVLWSGGAIIPQVQLYVVVATLVYISLIM